MPEETVEIAGDVVRLYRHPADGPRVLERQVSLRDFLVELSSLSGRRALERIPLLPAGARWVVLRGSSVLVAVEQPPQVRRVLWSPKSLTEPGPSLPHALALPYVIYLLLFYRGSFEEMRVYYRTAPITSEDDGLALPNLWNVSASESPLAKCRACLRGRPLFDDLSLAGQAQGAIEFFWSAGFNLDIEDNCFQRAATRDARIASLETWAGATEEDPLFPLVVNWEESGLSLRKAAEHLLDWRGAARPLEEVSDIVDMMYRLREERRSAPGA